jgi:hypothetical protein
MSDRTWYDVSVAFRPEEAAQSYAASAADAAHLFVLMASGGEYGAGVRDGELLAVRPSAGGGSVYLRLRWVLEDGTATAALEPLGGLLDVLEDAAIAAGASAWAAAEPGGGERQHLLLGILGRAGLCLPSPDPASEVRPDGWSGPWRACASPLGVLEYLRDLAEPRTTPWPTIRDRSRVLARLSGLIADERAASGGAP